MRIEDEACIALSRLAATVQVTGPIDSHTHTTYIVHGLADTPEQMCQLGWCLLGFIGGIYETDLSIDSAIGEGEQARDNLFRILKKRLGIGINLTDEQKLKNRDPLLQELMAHTLVLIHRSKPILPEWLGEIQVLRPPHLSANNSGLDLIAVGTERGDPFTAIGEAKAYASDPIGGFAKACEKFTQVRQGEYDDEIRVAIKDSRYFAREQLASNIWIETGRFGALVGHDCVDSANLIESCSHPNVTSQPSNRLFFISSPYGTDPDSASPNSATRHLFDALCDILTALAESLGA